MMTPLFSALRFLTIAPIPQSLCGNEGDLARSHIYYPVAGFVIGAALAFAGYIVLAIFPPLPAAALLIVIMSALSGGLHMDGLADTADGFYSGAPKEKIREIMKDSRTGAMGVIAIASVFLIKSSALYTALESGYLYPLLLAPIAGRCAMLIAMSRFTYTSGEGGIGRVFTENKKSEHAAWAGAFLFIFGIILAGIYGVVIAILVISYVFVFGAWSTRKIGGMTGDTYGALCETVEAITLLAISAVV